MVVLAAVALAGTKYLHRRFPLRYGGYIESYAEEYGLDKFMVAGVIYTESSFNNKAHSGLARGLMQLTDNTAAWVAGELGIDYDYDMAEDPETNIRMGCYYLSLLKEMYSDTGTALAAYNAGMGTVSKWLEDDRYSQDGKTLSAIPYRETENYVKKVELFTRIYRKLYEKEEWK